MAFGPGSTVGGGFQNEANGDSSTVVGGSSNQAIGKHSTVGGGNSNTAKGDFSFAAGRAAEANHQGAFVWKDSVGGGFASTAADQFLIKAAGGVGIRTNSPQAQFHVTDSVNRTGTAVIPGHVAAIENQNTGSNADVLALKVGRSDPDFANNFITFYGGSTLQRAGSRVAVGAIDGNGGGIRFQSGGADFAEWLPRLDLREEIEAGQIIGVVAGEVTRDITNSDRIMVVSTAPIVLGNMPPEAEENLYEMVAFVGQVPVKVRGPVKSGDYIVASGLNDGTGVAVSPEAMTASQHSLVVGQAWESSSDPGIKLVNTFVGSPSSPLSHRLTRDLSQLKLENEELRQRLEALEALLTARK